MSRSQLALGLSFALEMDVGQYHESDFDWMGPTSIQMLTTVGHIYNHVSVFPSGNRLRKEKKNPDSFIYLTFAHLAAAHLYLSGSVNSCSLIMAQLR